MGSRKKVIQLQYQRETTRPIILIQMMDLLLSLAAITYFPLTSPTPDSCYSHALAYNILHILTHLLILLPLLLNLLRKPSLCLSLAHLRREYIKTVVVSRFRMPLFCVLIIGVSLGCLYSIVVEIFVWRNYGYLFGVFCLVCCSLTQVSQYLQTRYDCSIYFSIEAYKFFCLVIASILFGISAHELALSAQLLSMSWAYFVYRSKQSLPKEIVYYLILFMDVVLLLTAILVIGTSEGLRAEGEGEGLGRGKGRLMVSVTFFGMLFAMEVYQFVRLYRSFGRTGSALQQQQKQKSLSQFYINLQHFKRRAPEKPEVQTDCSICLQPFPSRQKGDHLVLNCGHYYHSECLEQWAYINHTCPMCRKSMIENVEEISM